ncbi:radical SAM protein [[Empedobacter] haloabium]|uniref:Radical SAM protein n=1 Tax=[Empedobacter] haloabium TaxID=592317 RepID=A0ABZ1UJX7_9BURK
MFNDNPTGGMPVLQLHPSRRCNLACRHCYSSSGPDIRQELPIAMLAACLDDAYAAGYRQLAVSGGEPLMYGELHALLSHARELGMTTTMTTNGMLATARRWSPLAPLVDFLAVSIDGLPAEHDAIRGQAGAFDKTVRHLDVIRASGTAFGFIFTLTQHNVDSLEFVVRLAAQTGARAVQVHPLTMDGRATAMLPQARPDGLELIVALVEAARLGAALGVAVHVDAVTVEQLMRYRSRFVPALPVTSLTQIAPILVVQADGMVVPLTHGIAGRFMLGSLGTARLALLAERWLESQRPDELAQLCRRTWEDLTACETAPAALYWYEEVAVASRALIAELPRWTLGSVPA